MHKTYSLRTHTAALLLTILPVNPAGAGPPIHGVVTPFDAANLTRDADVKCLSSALETGDPDKGPSTFLLIAAPDCEVPAHYHTAGEQLIVTRGQVLTGMTGMVATPLGPGGFAAMPGKAVHWFTCRSKVPCTMFVIFDAAYDIVWAKKP